MVKLFDLMDIDLYEKMRDEKYVSVKRHPTQDLWIYNYTQAAMFDKVWNEVTEQCRGLICDGYDNVVARPWRKFYNWGERECSIGINDRVEITDKMDGSLGIGYRDTGGYWNVATRGSFSSEQATWATSWLEQTFPNWNPEPGYTPLWEIVYPENRIVLNYGDRAELVLLGCVDVEHGIYYGPKEAKALLGWPGAVTEVINASTINAYWSSNLAERPNREGVVVRFGNLQVKLKQEDYVRAHAIVTGLSNRGVWEALSKGESIPEQAAFMPDEFYQWLVQTATSLQLDWAVWKREVAINYDIVRYSLQNRGLWEDRKAFAEAVAPSQYRAALFKLYDNQSIDDLAWKAVKPAKFERPFSRNEDN